jgi:solute carrier family 45 protein 1/2/4
LVTALSSLIFALFEPDMSVLHGAHPGKTIPPVNGTIPGSEVAQNVTQAARAGTSMLVRLSLARREEVEAGVNSVAVIFRIGGAAALVACALTWRLAKEIKRAR